MMMLWMLLVATALEESLVVWLPRFLRYRPNIGLIYGKAHLFIVTILAIIFTAIWSALVTYGIIKVIAHYMPLRVSDRDEAIGLDDCEHKETAYPTFMGLDS